MMIGSRRDSKLERTKTISNRAARKARRAKQCLVYHIVIILIGWVSIWFCLPGTPRKSWENVNRQKESISYQCSLFSSILSVAAHLDHHIWWQRGNVSGVSCLIKSSHTKTLFSPLDLIRFKQQTSLSPPFTRFSRLAVREQAKDKNKRSEKTEEIFRDWLKLAV